MNAKLRDKLRLQDGHGPSPLVTTLALFIMLLAFFMLLVSKSEFKVEKTKPILESITETFKRRDVFLNPDGPGFVPDIDRHAGSGDETYAVLDDYFRSVFPGVQPRTMPSSGVFYMEFDRDEFEKKYFSGGPSQLKDMVDKLSSVRPQQMEIWMNVQGDPLTSSPETKASLEKVAGWASTLEEQGMNKNSIVIGLQKGDERKVMIIFRNYKPYAPMP